MANSKIEESYLWLFKALVKHALTGKICIMEEVSSGDCLMKAKEINQKLIERKGTPITNRREGEDDIKYQNRIADNLRSNLKPRNAAYPSPTNLDRFCIGLLVDIYPEYSSWKNFLDIETKELKKIEQANNNQLVEKRFYQITNTEKRIIQIIPTLTPPTTEPQENTNPPINKLEAKGDPTKPPVESQSLKPTINNFKEKLPLREKLPSYFKDKFFDEENSSLLPEINDLLNHNKIVCLYGVPGVGKSFLAMKIALDNQNKYDLVWILNADDPSTIEKSLEDFAERLFDKETVKQQKAAGGNKAIFKKLSHYLADKSWLIIYDNAGDSLDFTSEDENALTIYQFEKDYFLHEADAIHDKQKILLATRNEDWKNLGFRNFAHKEIGYWDDKKIKAFLERNSKISIEDESQLSILEGIPLIASIAKAFIDNSPYFQFGYFFRSWKSKKDKLLSDWKKQPNYLHEPETNEGRKRIALATTIELTYDKLSIHHKALLKVIAEFASNDFLYSISNEVSEPLYSSFYQKNNLFIKEWFSIDNKEDFDKLIDRLSRFSLIRKKLNAFSMHEFIQECVKIVDKNKKSSIIKAIQLLNNVVSEWGTAALPHSDHLLKNFTLITSNMSIENEEKNQASKLFAQSGYLHSQQGHNKVAEEHFRKGLEIVKDEAIEADLNKKLANVLFLKGGLWIDEASVKAEKALKYYIEISKILQDQKRILEVQKNILEVRNDVVTKIYQRLCRFVECEEELKEAEKIALVNSFEDKLSGIYHNFGSLYWTWGREEDYEKADAFFMKAYQATEESIKLKDNDKEASHTDKEKYKENKIFYENVSKMIHGAVLGLLKRYEDQEKIHQEAFEFFEKVGEQRRYTYTAYYQLIYGWDKEKITDSLPDKFDQDDLIKKVRKHESTLIDVDEKYQVIEKTVRLRLAVKERQTEVASKAYSELWTQLEGMMYKERNRYYDVDCLSVSGLVDYSDYLKNLDKEKSKEVAKNALKMIQDIQYPRREELNKLAE